MTRRIYIDANRVSISRPGYDAVTAPRTSDYMALDSSLDIERPLLAGLLTGLPINNLSFIYYPTTYATPPAVEVYEWLGGAVMRKQTILKWTGTGSTTMSVYTPFYVICGTAWFAIRQPGGGFVDSGYISTPRNWAYIVWRTS